MNLTGQSCRPDSAIAEVLGRLMAKENLAGAAIESVVELALGGDIAEDAIAAFLVALRMKGETAEELAAGARVLRRHMIKLDAGRAGILDTCGMGGDGSCTFNISTATAFVAAAAGVPVVKHGNRSVSSRSGSADVLTELGIEPSDDSQQIRRCLDEAGCAFCFAPYFHPAIKRFADLRRRLGVRTFFNLLGPLANPAGAKFQLLGVARPELLDPMALALASLGTSHAILVCGADGLDEVTLSGPTFVRLVNQDRVERALWRPEDFGMPMCTSEALRVETPAESAARIREVLTGSGGAATEVVLANAAAALLAARRVKDLREGVSLARSAIADGRAARVLEQVVHCSRGRKTS